ncbi:hypothetical protein [Streptomyces goshikiensis]|uniref:hypothetical protein n=1 Tax=Streptomyces goshikiensis TaxID=1942 RepID=UPI00368396E0
MSTATAPRVRQPGPLPDHGTASRYRRGCTCRPCLNAVNAESKKWEYLRSIGRSSLIPAGPAIARIWALRAAGMTDAEINAAAGLNSGRLNYMIRTGSPIRHFTAAKILAIPVPAPSDEPTRNGAWVPALGTVRRLQTLTADGWPLRVLEDRLGAGTGYLSYLIRTGTEGNVRLFTAANIRRFYDNIHQLQPEAHSPRLAGVTAARNRARKNGWPPSPYWDADDFDNPAFTPAMTEPPRYVVLAENGRELERLGHSRQQAADRLGVTKDALQHAIDYARKAAAA